MVNPTYEQLNVINSNINSVIIAIPGSGKTYVLSEKIKLILKEIPEFKGVIAISYTNKASEELKKRCLKGGTNKKSSFFGTIDSFYISEIIIPFGKQIFGIPPTRIITCKIFDLEELEQNYFINQEELNNQYTNIDILKQFFLRGIIILEAVGILANYIFDHSLSCKNYLKAKYTHLMIDEYQDSGKEQHDLFIKISTLNICSIAVGDAKQSIYAFSGKDPQFLFSLAQNNLFKLFPLNYNHRSHKSIINYSSALFQNINTNNDDICVFEKEIDGHQDNVAKWLNYSILEFSKYFNIKEYNNIGILFRNNFTGSIINNNLSINRKYYISTKIDNDNNPSSRVFRSLLYLIFDTNSLKINLLEELLGGEITNKKAKDLVNIIYKLEILFKSRMDNLEKIVEHFIEVSEIVFPYNKYNYSVEILKEILISDELINSFKPPQKNEVQLMTIHKSKGLEFDLVFHLDLYEWILPNKKIVNKDIIFDNYQQELNLHYVAITRARKGCVLCTSTKRHNQQNHSKNGKPSEFFYLNNTKELRLKSIY